MTRNFILIAIVYLLFKQFNLFAQDNSVMTLSKHEQEMLDKYNYEHQRDTLKKYTYPSGKFRYLILLNKQKTIREECSFYENGSKQFIASYNNITTDANTLDTLPSITFFYENGQIKAKGQFVKDKEVYAYYYESMDSTTAETLGLMATIELFRKKGVWNYFDKSGTYLDSEGYNDGSSSTAYALPNLVYPSGYWIYEQMR